MSEMLAAIERINDVKKIGYIVWLANISMSTFIPMFDALCQLNYAVHDKRRGARL